jgi:hypothetical protein
MAQGKHLKRSKSTREKVVDAVDGLPRGIAYEEGFRILGTPIGSGGAKKAGLQFISHVDEPLPRWCKSVLTTPFIAQAIGSDKRGVDALMLNYNRRIRLGKLDIRLFPAGLGPGSAQLEVAYEDRRIVFSGGARLSSSLGFSSIEFSKCDLLLLDAEPAQPRPPSSKRVAERLKRWIKDTILNGRIPVLCFGSRGAVFDTAWSLRHFDSRIYAYRPIYEMLRRVEGVGFTLNHLRRLQQRLPPKGIVFQFARLWPKSKFGGNHIRVAYVGPGGTVPPWASEAFRLGESEDRSGLVSYVAKMQPSQVALGPRCDEATSKMLCKAGFRVYRIHEARQMLLSFFEHDLGC